MQGGVFLQVTIGAGAPDRVHNGIPYEADGSVAISLAEPPHHYHQGLGFDAVGRLCYIIAAPNYFGSGGAPFITNGAGRLTLTTGGGVDHYSCGVGYSTTARLRTAVGPVPSPVIWVGTMGCEINGDNTNLVGYSRSGGGTLNPESIGGVNVNNFRMALSSAIATVALAGAVEIPDVAAGADINVWHDGFGLAPVMYTWDGAKYVTVANFPLLDFYLSRVGGNINIKIEEILI